MFTLDKLYDTPKRIEESFCIWFSIPKQKITDKKFLQILKTCWKHNIDMNFDRNPDFEDLQSIRNSDFKYYVLQELGNGYYEGKSIYDKQSFEQAIRDLF